MPPAMRHSEYSTHTSEASRAKGRTATPTRLRGRSNHPALASSTAATIVYGQGTHTAADGTPDPSRRGSGRRPQHGSGVLDPGTCRQEHIPGSRSKAGSFWIQELVVRNKSLDPDPGP